MNLRRLMNPVSRSFPMGAPGSAKCLRRAYRSVDLEHLICASRPLGTLLHDPLDGRVPVPNTIVSRDLLRRSSREVVLEDLPDALVFGAVSSAGVDQLVLVLCSAGVPVVVGLIELGHLDLARHRQVLGLEIGMGDGGVRTGLWRCIGGPAGVGPSLREWSERWIESMRPPEIEESTWRNYRGHVTDLQRRMGDLTLDRIDQGVVQELRGQFSARAGLRARWNRTWERSGCFS